MNVALKYPIVRLETLVANRRNALVGGPFGSNLVSRDYTSEGVPVIRGTNIADSKYVSSDGFVFVTERKADELRTNNAHPGDIVFTQRGTLGQVGIIPRDSTFSRFVISQSQMKMTVDPEKASVDYLYYYFRMPSMISYIENHALQAGVPHINLGILKRFEVVLPPLPTQRKIAAILTAYDDLIETNKRRIALLEKMAEELYREWFVRMRFPGHQNTRFVKGVPEGWDAIQFADICKFIKGKTPSELGTEPLEDYLPYVNAAFLRGQEFEFAKRGRNSVLCEQGDVLMLMDGSNSGLVFRAKNGIVASTFARIEMDQKYRHFIFEFIQASQESIVANNTGSAVPHANKEFINRLLIFLPHSDQLLADFNKKYQAFFDQWTNLVAQNDILTKTRDLLLPRLISGKLSVENLDIQFPPSMQEETPEPESAYAELHL